MPTGAVALVTGMPSAAYAQCFGSLAAITSVIGTVNTAFLPSGSAFLSSAPNSAPDQQASGVWTRAVGGAVETKSNVNFDASFTVTSPAGPPRQASLNTPCRSDVKQDFVGFEAGHDIAVLNTNNSDWHFGVLAGYVGTKLDTPAQGVSVSAQSGTVNAPSAGLYTAFSRGALSADAQARLYDLQSESLGQRIDGRGFSLAGNVSYRFDLPGNWTLEPSVGGMYSRTSIDPLNLADVNATLGVPVTGLPFLNPMSSLAVSGTLQIHDVESLLGRASVKLGTSLPLAGGQIVAYPFVTASVFHEFEGTATASFVASGTFPNTPPLPGTSQFQGGGTLNASSVGTFAQIGGGSAFQLANTGWVGYARVDYRTGDNIQGISGSAGLRYEFDSPSHVADNRARLPVKARPAEGYDWTGPYAGIYAGSTWGDMRWAFQGGSVNPDHAGFLGGGQAGYNFQTGRFVAGVEGDGGWSNARGAAACPVNPIMNSCEADVGVLGSLTGRFGYTWGRALFYGKGGWAFGQVTAGTNLNFTHLSNPAAGGLNVAQSTNWENGWTIGAGMEYALTDSWSAKAEYMYYAFPHDSFTVAQNATADATTAGNIVRIGLNYHFKP